MKKWSVFPCRSLVITEKRDAQIWELRSEIVGIALIMNLKPNKMENTIENAIKYLEGKYGYKRDRTQEDCA